MISDLDSEGNININIGKFRVDFSTASGGFLLCFRHAVKAALDGHHIITEVHPVPEYDGHAPCAACDEDA